MTDTAPPETPLDIAHATMEAAPEDGGARLGFYERVCDSTLYLPLEREAKDETLEPLVFVLDEGPVVPAFDREERLAGFAGRPIPYAALPGRVAVRMLAGQGIALGLNLGVAPSEILLPAEALAWLVQMLDAEPAGIAARPRAFRPPANLPQRLLAALDGKLARAGGLARAAYLAAVTYDDGASGHVMAFLGAAPGAEAALARAVGEALAFSGVETGALDVAFLAAEDPVTEALARAGIRFDLPRPAEAVRRAPAAPGSDPDRPPILR